MHAEYFARRELKADVTSVVDPNARNPNAPRCDTLHAGDAPIRVSLPSDECLLSRPSHCFRADGSVGSLPVQGPRRCGAPRGQPSRRPCHESHGRRHHQRSAQLWSHCGSRMMERYCQWLRAELVAHRVGGVDPVRASLPAFFCRGMGLVSRDSHVMHDHIEGAV